MSNFWARTITGLSMVFLILAALFLSRLAFAAIFFLVVLSGLLEFYTITTTGACRPQKTAGTVLGTAWYLLTVYALFRPIGGGYLPSVISILALILLFFLPFIIEIFRREKNALLNVAITIMGMIYVAIPLALLNVMNTPRSGIIFGHFAAYLTSYFLITWIYDTGAYLIGKNFGRHKFFERISPKKTWEGTLGGIVTASLAAVGLFFISDGARLSDFIVLTGLVIVFGTFGDLAESLFKRSLNLKDSGNILPGHGGILDRFDTIFISAPFVFLYFVLFQILI